MNLRADAMTGTLLARLPQLMLYVKRTFDITRAAAVCGQEHERWKSFQAVLRKDLRSQVVYE